MDTGGEEGGSWEKSNGAGEDSRGPILDVLLNNCERTSSSLSDSDGWWWCVYALRFDAADDEVRWKGGGGEGDLSALAPLGPADISKLPTSK